MIAVYDACVLYPAPVRDILIEIAISGLVQANWTDQIHQEWVGKLAYSRPEIKNAVQKPNELMNEAILYALVENCESLIDSIYLPDQLRH